MRINLIAFCCGIWLLQQQAQLPPARWAWLLPLLSAVLLLPRFPNRVPEALRRLLVALLCAALGFAWAAWRADLKLADRLPAHWQGVDITLVGVVSELPQANARGERFVIDVEQVTTPGAPRLKHIQLTRYWPRESAFNTVEHKPTVQAGRRTLAIHGSA